MQIFAVDITVLLDEMHCPYSCYFETLRLPGGQLLNETFGCDNRCSSSLSSTDKCTQVVYMVFDFLQITFFCC